MQHLCRHVVIAALLGAAGCASPEPRHRCVEIPNNLVECSVIEAALHDAATAAAPAGGDHVPAAALPRG